MDRIATGFLADARPHEIKWNRRLRRLCEREPAQTVTRPGSLCPGTARRAKSRRSDWPCFRGALGHEDYLVLGSAFDYWNAWSARKWTMVNPRGLTASSLFFTLSRKT